MSWPQNRKGEGGPAIFARGARCGKDQLTGFLDASHLQTYLQESE